MTGYQEILTDPSYRGQIVTMTYPEIGNYGVNAEDVESAKPHLAGFIVREQSRRVSNFRADGDLDDYLQRWGIVGLEGIDTRALVRRLRTQGAMKGVLSTRRSRRRQPGGQGQGQPGPGRPRPGPRGDPRRSRRVERAAERAGPSCTAVEYPTPGPDRAARRGPGLRHEVEHRPASVRAWAAG